MAGTDIIPLFAAPATAANGEPSGAPSATGFGAAGVGAIVQLAKRATEYNLVVRITATGALSAVPRLWLYHRGLVLPAAPTVDLHAWGPAGKGAMGDRGKINDPGTGTAVAITGTNVQTHIEPFGNLGPIDGAYLEITAPSGTNFSCVAMLVAKAF